MKVYEKVNKLNGLDVNGVIDVDDNKDDVVEVEFIEK